MKLFRGLRTRTEPFLPTDMADIGQPLYFTPYQRVADFFGSQGMVGVYAANWAVQCQPHNRGILDMQVDDFEAVLQPADIARLRLLYTYVPNNDSWS